MMMKCPRCRKPLEESCTHCPHCGVLLKPPALRRTAGRALRAALTALFSAVLMIPAARRLRRQRRVWTAIRLALVAIGVVLVFAEWKIGFWKGIRQHPLPAGAGVLAILIALLARDLAQEDWLEQLVAEDAGRIVLPSAALIARERAEPVAVLLAQTSLLIAAKAGRGDGVTELPFASIRSLNVELAAQDGEREMFLRQTGPTCLLRIAYTDGTGVEHEYVLGYGGTFAEHLARVTEKSLRARMSPALPVLPH